MGTMGSFLTPDGFARPPLTAVLGESSLVLETGRYLARSRAARPTRRATPTVVRVASEPVILVPGFMAGDGTLALLAHRLRGEGLRTYRSHIRANIGCTRNAAALLESRIEAIALKRGARVQIVGHSLGGLLGRGLAVRRPDLVSGVVTMGSPMLAPGAHHLSLTVLVEMLNRLSRAGVPGLMAEDCVAGECAATSFAEAREPLSDGVRLTAVWSKRDGIVDPRSCVDPEGTSVEVRASHLGMAVDPATHDAVLAALRQGISRTGSRSTPTVS